MYLYCEMFESMVFAYILYNKYFEAGVLSTAWWNKLPDSPPQLKGWWPRSRIQASLDQTKWTEWSKKNNLYLSQPPGFKQLGEPTHDFQGVEFWQSYWLDVFYSVCTLEIYTTLEDLVLSFP